MMLDFFLQASEAALERNLKEVADTLLFDGEAIETPFAINSFHPEAVRMVERNDARFLGRRANHFVLMYGWSEDLFLEPKECVLCLCNHKGTVALSLWQFDVYREDADHA